jgi:hypothetical protein
VDGNLKFLKFKYVTKNVTAALNLPSDEISKREPATKFLS